MKHPKSTFRFPPRGTYKTARGRHPEFYRIRTVAFLMDVCTETVRNWIKTGRLKARRVGPKRHTVLIKREHVEELVRHAEPIRRAQ